MTVTHMLDGLMQATGARNHNKLGEIIGMDPATVHRMYRGQLRGLNMKSFDLIQLTSEVSADQLLAWYRMPESAVLGRIQTAVVPKTRVRVPAR